MGCVSSKNTSSPYSVSVNPNEIDENLHIEVAVLKRGQIVRWIDAVQVQVNELAQFRGTAWGSDGAPKIRVRILDTPKARQEGMVGTVADIERCYVRQKMPAFLDAVEERLTTDIGDPFDPKYITLREEVIAKLKTSQNIQSANRLARELTDNNKKCRRYFGMAKVEGDITPPSLTPPFRSPMSSRDDLGAISSANDDGDAGSASKPLKGILKGKALQPSPSNDSLCSNKSSQATRAETQSHSAGDHSSGSAAPKESRKLAKGISFGEESNHPSANDLTAEQQESVKKRFKKKASSSAASQKKPEYIASYIPNPTCLTEWRAGIEGPPNTPYEGGFFCLLIEFEEGYPFVPPKIQFTTPVFHPNVSQRGKICLNMLKASEGEWSALMTVESLCLAILTLMQAPNPDDPLNNFAAKLCEERPQAFAKKAREWTERFCMSRRDSKKKTRFSFEQDSVGGIDSDPHSAWQQDENGNVLTEEEALAKVTRVTMADRIASLNKDQYAKAYVRGVSY